METIGQLLAARRDLSRFKQPVHEFDGVAELEAADAVPAGIVAVRAAGTYIDMLFDPVGSDTTVVTFHAALRKGAQLPLFAGGTVFQDGPVNRILVSDPGLYASPTLNLAWFAGTHDLRLQELFPRVLRRLFAAAGGRRLIFFGPSGGGFAALYYSRLFPESLAVAVNPQTILMNFSEPHRRAYAAAAHGAESPADADAVFRDVLDADLREHYAGEVPNHVLYIQNEPDHQHVDGHLRPFLATLPDHSRITVLMGNWGEGHTGPKPDELRALAREITSRSGDWGDVLSQVAPRGQGVA